MINKNNILAVSNSLLKYYGLPIYHPSLDILDKKLLNKHKNIILLILDGMGIDLIEKNLSKDSFIRQHIIAQISSVFPPTTAAATTAFHSGLSPWESGWLGWMCYYRKYDEIIETFRNKAFYSGKKMETPAPYKDILKYETIYEKIIKNNPSIEYHKIFPSFEVGGVDSFQEMCDKIIALATKNDNSKLFCAYWIEPDHSTHQYGTNSNEVKNILLDIDYNIQKLNNSLKDSLVIISADHGEIDVEEIYLNKYSELCNTFLRPPALEARFITFFIKENNEKYFYSKFKEIFENDFHLYTKEEFLGSGILGSGKMHSEVPNFLGQFVAISKGNKSLRYSTGEKEFKSLKADHAGLSKEEMFVPLILLEKN